MGFIEELRRKKAEEDERASRASKLREAVEETALRRNREQEERISRERPLRATALQGSIVPKALTELSILTHKNTMGDLDEYDGISEKLIIKDILGGKKRHVNSHDGSYYERDFLLLEVVGQLDGSVRIGNQILSSSQANNPSMVESALEKAYKNPIKRTIRYEYDRVHEHGPNG